MSQGALSATGPLGDSLVAGSAPAPVMEAERITKRFGGALALDDVSLVMERGRVHALVGENGAGKSTLGRIISGIIRPDHGELRLSGRVVRLATPRDARREGIAAVSQELTLVPQLSVLENIFLGVEQRRRGMFDRRDARARFVN